MGFVDVAYFATALRRTQETTMVLERLSELCRGSRKANNLHGANAKDRAKESLLARAEVQFDQLRNWDQYDGHIQADVECSCYQIESVLVDAVVRRPRSIPGSPYC